MSPDHTRESRSWRVLGSRAKAEIKNLVHRQSSRNLNVAGSSYRGSSPTPTSSTPALGTDTALQVTPASLIAGFLDAETSSRNRPLALPSSSTADPSSEASNGAKDSGGSLSALTPLSTVASPTEPAVQTTSYPSVPDSLASADENCTHEKRPDTTTKPNLWLRAYEAATSDTKKWIDGFFDVTLSLENDKGDQVWVEELLELVKSLQKQYYEDSVQIKIGRRRISPRDCVAVSMTWLAKIGDIVIKFSPNPSGLAWSVIKALLQIPMTGVGETTAILAYSARILGILGRGKAYEAVYKDDNTPMELLQTLETGLVALYAKSLDLLAYAAQHFKNDYRKILGWITDPGHAESNMAELIQCERDVVWAAECCESARRTAADKGHAELLQSLRESAMHISDDMRHLFGELEAQEMLEALDYFSNVKFGEHHQKKAEARTPGTGQWLLQHRKFQEWDSTEKSAILWLHGTVGMGKSFLASSVIDHFLNPVETTSRSAALNADDDQGLAFFYCERGSVDLSEPISVLRSFVRQLSTVPCYPNLMQAKYIQLYREKRKQGSNLSVKECRDQLLVSANLYPRTTLILDGLDECNPEERWKLIGILSELVNQAENPVKLFISSRREQDIAAKLDAHNIIEINADDNRQDIVKFVKLRIEEIEKTGRWNSISTILKDKVEKTACEKSQGMFRWTYLQMDQLSKCRQEKQLEARLGKLPKTLNSAYDEIFRGLQEDDRDVLERAVKWVMCATSPLTTDELLDAVTLSIGSDGTSLRFNPKIAEETLLEICSHLIVKDSKSGRWRFPHTSVIEYFEEVHLWNLEQAHSFVAKICLLYLLDDASVEWIIHVPESDGHNPHVAWHFWTGRPRRRRRRPDNLTLLKDKISGQTYTGGGFQDYVRFGWFRHVSALDKLETHDSEVSKLLKQFMGLDQSPVQSSRQYQRWVELFYSYKKNDEKRDYSYLEGYGEFLPAECPLIGLCILGFHHLLQDYWASPIDVLPVNKAKRDLLSIAAYHGHLKICKSLIDCGANANRQIDGHPNDYNVLSTAVRRGYVDILRLLIDHGADPNIPLNGRSPLCASVEKFYCNYNGNVECLEILLKAKADPNLPCGSLCSTTYALEGAVRGGHIKGAKLLLENGANPNIRMNGIGFDNLLIAAAVERDRDMCQLLLVHGADVNAHAERGDYGSPLQAAVGNGDSYLCQIFLDYGADANASFKRGEYGSALAAAAFRGDQNLCQLLLDHGADANASLDFGKYGSSLTAAASQCHKEVCRLLIEHGADVNKPLQGGEYSSVLAAALISDLPHTFTFIRYLVEEVHIDTSILSVSPPLKSSHSWADSWRRRQILKYLVEGNHVKLEVLIGIGYMVQKYLYGGSLAPRKASSISELKEPSLC